MPVYVNNLQEKMKVDSKLPDVLVEIVETALKVGGRGDDPEVSIALVDDDYIRELNNKFRNKDQSTDVLSFAMEESVDDEPEIEGGHENILGDIIISLETAELQAGEYGHSFLREMSYLVTHGMFHLLGYDHEDEDKRRVMREREEKVLSMVNVTR